MVTAGASEAVLFSFIACLDPGDEIITTDPTYANYIAFAEAAEIRVRTILTGIEDRFCPSSCRGVRENDHTGYQGCPYLQSRQSVRQSVYARRDADAGGYCPPS